MRLILLIICSVWLLLPVISTYAQNELSIGISKQIGTAISDKISGTFKITVNSEIPLQNLTLFINNTQVAFTEGNSLSYTLHTGDFRIGFIEIKAIGYTANGNMYERSIQREIIDDTIISLLAIGLVVIVVGTSVTRFILRKYSEKRDKQKDHKKKMEEVGISKKF